MTDTPMEIGTRVRYHGSLEDNQAARLGSSREFLRYGDVEYVVIRSGKETDPAWSADGYRYLIAPVDPEVMVGSGKLHNYLYNVRRDSITPVPSAESPQ